MSDLRIPGLILAILFLHISCSKADPKDQPAIQINAFTMTAREFEESFSNYEMKEDTPENRADFFNNLVTRKLLLEEGVKQGLDREKNFLRTIENFWEQSLLKLVVDRKVKEISKSITVTDSEIEAQYQKWLKENPAASKSLSEARSLIEWRIRKAKEAQAMEEWTNELMRKAVIKADKKAIRIES